MFELKIEDTLLANRDVKVLLNSSTAEQSIIVVDDTPPVWDVLIPEQIISDEIETGDFGLRVRVGEKGPVSTIKRNELALRKSDARPERWAKNDKLDASIIKPIHPTQMNL